LYHEAAYVVIARAVIVEGARQLGINKELIDGPGVDAPGPAKTSAKWAKATRPVGGISGPAATALASSGIRRARARRHRA